jgi:alkanesulfonate monooxygenase SsuD/methylene tetrahydromethanopterin reductase-like flavin-dependent oxidoreductase (luciferase family)
VGTGTFPYPLTRKSPHPAGIELPKEYYDAMDPFVSLSVIAQPARTIKIATGVALIPQRDPIQTAKLVASLDQMSRGRLLLGVGGGWNQDEMEDHGTVFATRFHRLRESIQAMKQIWTEEKAEYHGEFVKLRPDDRSPKTVPEALSANPCWRRIPTRGATGHSIW